MQILSGDVGGTNTRLQLTTFKKRTQFQITHQQSFLNREFADFPSILKTFLEKSETSPEQIQRACFAVAGPIAQGKVQCTNLPWYLEEEKIAAEMGFKHVTLMNDFEAVGYGISSLSSENLHTLQEGHWTEFGPISIIGAGTGLGVALLHQTQHHFMVTPTEGGHVDFAPTDETQMELLAYLRKKHHRVSDERVLSGLGIANIYKFCRDFPLYNQQENPELKFLIHNASDPTADIFRFALDEGDPIALRTLDIFIQCYGSIAGNLALTTLPKGGLFIVGGIAPKILPSLKDGRFLKSFLDKGRMSDLLKQIPIHLVLDPHIGLQGAANYAYQICDDERKKGSHHAKGTSSSDLN